MIYIYRISLLMLLFIGTVQAQEEKEKNTSKEDTEIPEDKVSTMSYSDKTDIETFKTNILGSILADFKDKLAKQTPKSKLKKRTPLKEQHSVVLLEKYTFLDNEKLNPEFMINWCFSVHDLSEKSYTYSEKYKDFCKTIKRKDLEKITENGIELEQDEWEEDAIKNLNERLNIRYREVRKILEDIKAKKKEKRAKKKEKRARKKEKRARKKEKEKKKKEVTDVPEKDLSDSKDSSYTQEPDIEMVKLIKEDVIEGKLVLKVSEPIFTKNKKKAIVLVTETKNNIVTVFVKVLKKSKGERWCIKGEVEARRTSKDKSKFKKRKVIVKEYEDDGVNFVDGKKLSEIGKQTSEEKMIQMNKNAKIKRLSSVSSAYLDLEDQTRYDLFFKDITSEENEIVKFSFRGPKTSDFNDIYNVIKSGFETAVINETVKIKANEELIGLKYLNQNGTRVVQFIKYNGDTTATSKALTKEEINKLFKNQGIDDGAKPEKKETDVNSSSNEKNSPDNETKEVKEDPKQENNKKDDSNKPNKK